MANRDYVRKKPAPSKKNNNRNQRKPAQRKKPAARAIPWKIAILALILLSGLLALLFMLNSDPEPTPTSAVPVAPAPQQTKTTEALPPPPEEQWDYIKSLPEREIQVKAREVEVPKIPYIMQCGAYKSKAQAEERKANIAFQGLASKIVKLEGSSWYRVILGTYTFKRDAVKEQHILQRAKIEPCIIMRDTLK